MGLKGGVQTIGGKSVNVEITDRLPKFTSTPVKSTPVREYYIYPVIVTHPDEDTITTTTLPSWLSFDQTTNILSGTPMYYDIDSYNIVLTVTNNAGEATQSFTIEVTDDSELVSSLINFKGIVWNEDDQGMTFNEVEIPDDIIEDLDQALNKSSKPNLKAVS